MPIERPHDRAARLELAVLLALAGLLALAPVLAAQQQRDDPQAPTGSRELPPVPDQDQRPGEPPPTVESEDPGVDQVEEKELGSFFVTSFSLASAYDKLNGDASATALPGAPPPLAGSDGSAGSIEYLAVPSFLLVHRPSSRSNLVAAYEPEILTVQDDPGNERVSHSAGVVYERRATRRTDITAGGSYLDSMDPTRHLGGEGFVLIPGRFEQTRGFFGASHLWPRATRLHFYSEYATAKSELRSDQPAFDVDDISGTLALEQGIGHRSNFTAAYSYTKTDVNSLDTAVDPRDSLSGPVDTFRVGFGHRLDQLSFNLSAGVQREIAQGVETQDDISWIGAAEVARETDKITLRLRYDRSLFAFGYGDAAVPSGVEGPLADGAALRDTLADTLSFFFEFHPLSRVRFEQALWVSRETVIEGDDLDSFVTGSLVEVLLTGKSVHRLLLFSRFDYYDRSQSDLLGQALSRTRFSLGFRVGLTGPQTRVGQRLATTQLRKVLPSAGRL